MVAFSEMEGEIGLVVGRTSSFAMAEIYDVKKHDGSRSYDSPMTLFEAEWELFDADDIAGAPRQTAPAATKCECHHIRASS